jgi:hypothetical protein
MHGFKILVERPERRRSVKHRLRFQDNIKVGMKNRIWLCEVY